MARRIEQRHPALRSARDPRTSEQSRAAVLTVDGQEQTVQGRICRPYLLTAGSPAPAQGTGSGRIVSVDPAPGASPRGAT